MRQWAIGKDVNDALDVFDATRDAAWEDNENFSKEMREAAAEAIKEAQEVKLRELCAEIEAREIVQQAEQIL